MNVLYLLNYAGSGGSEKYIETLIDALDGQITPFFAYNISGALSEKLERRGVPCFQLTMRSPFDFKAAWELAKLCRASNIDVIHTHFMRENFIAALATSKAKAPKVLNTVHMTDSKSGFIAKLNAVVSESNIATIAVSNSVLGNLRREKVSRPTLIYNGVDTERYAPAPIPHERFTVACIGRFSREKGQRYLIEAARKLPELRFVFAGEGTLREELEASAPANCEFQGYLDDARQLLNSSDLYVCPSLEEALGLSVLEAMACGLPVVVTDAGGLPEVVAEGCGIIVPKGDSAALADAIHSMANDSAMRAACAQSALKRVRERFSLSDTAAQVLALYK